MSLSISYTSRKNAQRRRRGRRIIILLREKNLNRKLKMGDLLEYAKVRYGEYFGTPKDKIEDLLNEGRDVILEIDVQGSEASQRNFCQETIFDLYCRSINGARSNEESKHVGPKQMNKFWIRFETAYREINEIPKYNYIVVNDKLERCSKKSRSYYYIRKMSSRSY